MKNKTFMKIAKIISRESYCKRSKVGAIIVKDDRIISIGYNGTPTGKTRCENGIIVKDNSCEDENGNTRPDVIHAEINAILFAAKNGISVNSAKLYVTMSPCNECAKAIIQSGIKEVYYEVEYRDTTGIEILKDNKIEVKEI